MRKVGIKQQIERATMKTQVAKLLNEARSFQNIHPATLRKCERAALKRVHELAALTD